MGALKRHDLGPALEWARAHRAELSGDRSDGTMSRNRLNSLFQSSSLEMKLHRLQYVELLRSGKRTEAVLYARENFSPFWKVHSDIRHDFKHSYLSVFTFPATRKGDPEPHGRPHLRSGRE